MDVSRSSLSLSLSPGQSRTHGEAGVGAGQTLSHLYVVMPVFHDSASAQVVIDGTRDAVGTELRVVQSVTFLVVDDSAGRDDGCAVFTKESGVALLVPSRQLGHQWALVAALRWITPHLQPGDIVVTMDSDGEDQPGDVAELVRRVKDGDADICVAERGRRHVAAPFRVGYGTFRTIFRIMTGHAMKTGNFAAVRAEWLIANIDDPVFGISYSSALVALKAQRASVTCDRGARIHGKSRMHTMALIRHGLFSMLAFADVIAARAFVFFVSVLTVSALTAVAVLAVKLLTDAAVPGWATVVILGALGVSVGGLLVFLASLTVFTMVSVFRASGSAPITLREVS